MQKIIYNPDIFVEIQIKLETEKEQRDIIRELWELSLENDPTFHFLHEPGYLLLRCSGVFVDEHIEFLDRRGIEYDALPYWVDGSPTVERYKQFFAEYFHLISVLVLENGFDLTTEAETGEKRSEYHILERIAHCFYNVAPFITDEDRVYSFLTISRAWVRGYEYGRKAKEDPERI